MFTISEIKPVRVTHVPPCDCTPEHKAWLTGLKLWAFYPSFPLTRDEPCGGCGFVCPAGTLVINCISSEGQQLCIEASLVEETQ